MPLLGPIDSVHGIGAVGGPGRRTPATIYPSVDRVLVSTRHPEGDFIPYGRGIGGWEPLPHPNVKPVTPGIESKAVDRRDLPGSLPPQILNPPQIFEKKAKSVLDVINEIIYPTKKEAAPVSHIFGIPHSIGEIATGIIDWGTERLFGATAPITTLPNFPTGFSPWDSAPEIISEGFQEAYQFSQDLNVGTVTNGGTKVATFLGCPVEEPEGCQPSKKRYTITIDEATGQCIKIKRQKSRKRRRRLASLSDIKDIAALKQVLGGGKTLDTWIATRGR